ncbi:MAG: TonB-dependent receptor [Methylococcales bacterium]|nr:TonB-dependent receptor [Methylococcales bacterium]
MLDEREGTEHEVKNLGFSDKLWQARLQYKFSDHHRLYYAYGNYKGKDIAFTHGAATSQVFFYDTFNRLSHLAGYELNDVSVLDQLNLTYSNQMITRGTFQGLAINETILESNSFQLKGISHMGSDIDLTIGAEFTQDQAETQTLADQDYYAGYFNLDYERGDWVLTTGLRGNFWTAKQHLIDQHNTDVIDDLVGISGKIEDIDDHALTYAFGMIYSVTSTQNLSFNYSRTYRFPSLYERFSFDNFIGGGTELNAEKGHNFEWAWKYLSDPWFAKASLFYSKFDSYLGTVSRRKLINPQGLQQCIEGGKCNPTIGEYDDREQDFFSSSVYFENLGEVSNKGFEISTGIIEEGDYEAGFNIGLNDIEADNVFAEIDSNPLELSAHYKKTLSFIPLKPWIKIKARYVTDWPKVSQNEGVNSFFSADAYLGIRYEYAKK